MHVHICIHVNTFVCRPSSCAYIGPCILHALFMYACVCMFMRVSVYVYAHMHRCTRINVAFPVAHILAHISCMHVCMYACVWICEGVCAYAQSTYANMYT